MSDTMATDLAVVSIAKMNSNESIDMKLYDDHKIILTQSKYITGVLSKINNIHLNNLSTEEISNILSQSVNKIEIDPSAILNRDDNIKCEIIIFGIPDGSIGIDLEPILRGAECGGLKVTNAYKHTLLLCDDIIIAINNIEIKSINVQRAIELLINTSSRTLTILRPTTVEPPKCLINNPIDKVIYGNIPQSVLIHRSRAKKYSSRPLLSSYRDFICCIEKRFISRPSFDYIPTID